MLINFIGLSKQQNYVYHDPLFKSPPHTITKYVIHSNIPLIKGLLFEPLRQDCLKSGQPNRSAHLGSLQVLSLALVEF